MATPTPSAPKKHRPAPPSPPPARLPPPALQPPVLKPPVLNTPPLLANAPPVGGMLHRPAALKLPPNPQRARRRITFGARRVLFPES
jgi:hypothetical protein